MNPHELLEILSETSCGVNAPETPFAHLSPEDDEALRAIARGEIEAATDRQRIDAILGLPVREDFREQNREFLTELLHTAEPPIQLPALHRLQRDDAAWAAEESLRLLAEHETSPIVALTAAEIALEAASSAAIPLIEELHDRWQSEHDDEDSPSIDALAEMLARA